MPTFSKVHSLVQFWTDFFTFSTESCILPCFPVSKIWLDVGLPFYFPVCLCYLFTNCGIKTKGEASFSPPTSQDPFTKFLISWEQTFPLAIAVAWAWDSQVLQVRSGLPFCMRASQFCNKITSRHMNYAREKITASSHWRNLILRFEDFCINF